MISVKLEIASNGVIKTVIDDNYNGAGSEFNSRTVYETDSQFTDDRLKNVQKFLYEISEDLGIDLGNRYDSKVLNFEIGWGSKYAPNIEEVNKALKFHRNQIKDLKDWKVELEKQAKNGK